MTTENQKDAPIIFSAPMIRTILGGIKTQTRRVVSPSTCRIQLPNSQHQVWDIIREHDLLSNATSHGAHLKLTTPDDCTPDWFLIEARHALINRLWVKENILVDGYLDPWYAAEGRGVSYVDAHTDRDWPYREPEYTGTIPSIHMPRWASRLTLDVTDVKVERLQDISEADAQAEGIVEATLKGRGDTIWHVPETPGHVNVSAGLFGKTACVAYQRLWDSINKGRKDKDGKPLPYAWDKNPWVVATTFDWHLANIDTLNREPKS